MKPDAPTPPRRRRGRFAVAAFLGAVLLAFVVGEVALRVSGRDLTYVNALNSFHENDPVLGFRGRRNFSARFKRPAFDVLVSHNSQGFRRVENPKDPARVKQRLFLFGDSVTWGWGAEQGRTFADHLNRLLPDHQVLNYGINGTGTVVQYTLFDREVKDRVQPGDAVVVWFVWNDIGDNVERGRLHAEIKDGKIETAPPYKPVLSGHDSVLDRIRVINYLHAAINLWKIKRGTLDEATRLTESDPAVVVTRHFLTAFQTACRARKARLIVGYVPGTYEIPGEEEVASPLALEQDRGFRTLFEGMARTCHLEVLDLLPAYVEAKKANPGVRLTLLNDGHPTEAGHELIAKLTAARLASPPPD